jgi:ferredoxin-type protein NapH
LVQRLRVLIQIIFLLFFVSLLRMGRMQLWMMVILATVLLAAGLGRFYCGWICPINTLMGLVEGLARKMGWKGRPVPGWARSRLLRWLILAVLVVVMGLTMGRGIKLPFILLIIPLAIGFTLCYNSVLWHRYLCPFGILFSLTSQWAPVGLKVDRDKCSSCGLCTRVCPAEAVSLRGKGETARIENRYCLECFLCQEACPRGAISFGVGRQRVSG